MFFQAYEFITIGFAKLRYKHFKVNTQFAHSAGRSVALISITGSKGTFSQPIASL